MDTLYHPIAHTFHQWSVVVFEQSGAAAVHGIRQFMQRNVTFLQATSIDEDELLARGINPCKRQDLLIPVRGEELDSRASLNTGTPTRFSMVQGIDDGMDAAIFLGYHARAGSLAAILDHTWSSVRIANLWLNGRLTGEFGLNASLCGHFGVPVLMVSGDQTVCAEASEWVPSVATAQVKTAAGRYAANCLPFEVSRKLITDTSHAAVKSYLTGKAPAPLKIKEPISVTIEYFHSYMADQAALLPSSTRLDGRRIEFKAGNMIEAYSTFRTAVNMVS